MSWCISLSFHSIVLCLFRSMNGLDLLSLVLKLLDLIKIRFKRLDIRIFIVDLLLSMQALFRWFRYVFNTILNLVFRHQDILVGIYCVKGFLNWGNLFLAFTFIYTVEINVCIGFVLFSKESFGNQGKQTLLKSRLASA